MGVNQIQGVHFEKKESFAETRKGATTPLDPSRSSTKACPNKQNFLLMPREATININNLLCTESVFFKSDAILIPKVIARMMPIVGHSDPFLQRK